MNWRKLIEVAPFDSRPERTFELNAFMNAAGSGIRNVLTTEYGMIRSSPVRVKNY